MKEMLCVMFFTCSLRLCCHSNWSPGSVLKGGHPLGMLTGQLSGNENSQAHQEPGVNEWGRLSHSHASHLIMPSSLTILQMASRCSKDAPWSKSWQGTTNTEADIFSEMGLCLRETHYLCLWFHFPHHWHQAPLVIFSLSHICHIPRMFCGK